MNFNQVKEKLIEDNQNKDQNFNIFNSVYIIYLRTLPT